MNGTRYAPESAGTSCSRKSLTTRPEPTSLRRIVARRETPIGSPQWSKTSRLRSTQRTRLRSSTSAARSTWRPLGGSETRSNPTWACADDHPGSLRSRVHGLVEPARARPSARSPHRERRILDPPQPVECRPPGAHCRRCLGPPRNGRSGSPVTPELIRRRPHASLPTVPRAGSALQVPVRLLQRRPYAVGRSAATRS